MTHQHVLGARADEDFRDKMMNDGVHTFRETHIDVTLVPGNLPFQVPLGVMRVHITTVGYAVLALVAGNVAPL